MKFTAIFPDCLKSAGEIVDRPVQVIDIEIQPYQAITVSMLRRNPPGEGIVTQLEYSKVRQLPNPPWNLTAQLVVRQGDPI